MRDRGVFFHHHHHNTHTHGRRHHHHHHDAGCSANFFPKIKIKLSNLVPNEGVLKLEPLEVCVQFTRSLFRKQLRPPVRRHILSVQPSALSRHQHRRRRVRRHPLAAVASTRFPCGPRHRQPHSAACLSSTLRWRKILFELTGRVWGEKVETRLDNEPGNASVSARVRDLSVEHCES